MSLAFVKEGEYQPLNTVAPNLGALLFYLRRENGGVPVREFKSYYSERYGREVYEMSDGLGYALDDSSHWYILPD
jgi:hypothetical protein